MLRFFCIIQLCIGFSLLLSGLCTPTLGTIYEDKKKLLTIESALGDTTGLAWRLSTDSEKEILLRNQEFLKNVPQEDIEKLCELKKRITEKKTSYLSSMLVYLFQNPYFLLYIIFSILIPLLLLLRIASENIIIFLPLVAACFVFDNALFAPIAPETVFETLIEKAKAIKVDEGFIQERRSKPFLMLFFTWNMLFTLISFKQLKKNVYVPS